MAWQAEKAMCDCGDYPYCQDIANSFAYAYEVRRCHNKAAAGKAIRDHLEKAPEDQGAVRPHMTRSPHGRLT